MTKRALDPEEIDWDDVSRVMSEGSNFTINPDYLRRLYTDGEMTLDGMQRPRAKREIEEDFNDGP